MSIFALTIGFSDRPRDGFIAAVVKKTKPRRPAKKRAAQFARMDKPAVRSHAYGRAILDAKTVMNDPARLLVLFGKASEKAALMSKDPFKDTWAYFHAMLRLVRSYARGEYRAISQPAMLSIVSALNYLVDPFDLIPDEVPFLGLLDDATVMTFAVRRTKEDLDDFMTWEIVAAD
ncbi:MAG: hypothetical protein QOG48_906 [Verrucomicrobiota bacterium]|jgi:uncharacterized membrane protein YkvA (DUF1232 family)